MADASLVGPAIKELKKKYDITLVTLGAEPSITDEHHKWVNLMDFNKTLADLNLDIAIVPLIDSPYNRCKSNIAIQEFSMLKIPVVASPTQNQTGMPCLYAQNNYEWYEQLEKLVKDKKFRKELGDTQYDFVRTNYDVKKLTPNLIKFFEKCPRKDLTPK